MTQREVLEKALTELKEEFVRRAIEAKTVASGKTNEAFEVRMFDNSSGAIYGNKYSGVLERGRKPGKTPYDTNNPNVFYDILRRWAEANKLTFDDEKAKERFVRAVAWKIKREGTKLYRSGKTNDIFTTPIEEFREKVSEQILEVFSAEIRNQIFQK